MTTAYPRFDPLEARSWAALIAAGNTRTTLMVIIPKTADLHAKVVATIEAGRAVAEVWDATDVDVGTDLRLIRQLMAELAGGEVFDAAQEAALLCLATHILAHFGKHLPAYVDIARRGSTEDYPLEDATHDGVRIFWARLHEFRKLRQLVLDEIRAEQLIAKLRRVAR